MAPLLSLALNVIAGSVLVDGVPAMTPLELKVNPEGSVPEVIAQVQGAVPPVATRVWE